MFLCLMRSSGKTTDKVNAPIAGMLASFAIVVDASKRSQVLSTEIFARAIYIFMVLLAKKKYPVTFKYGSTIFFTVFLS